MGHPHTCQLAKAATNLARPRINLQTGATVEANRNGHSNSTRYNVSSGQGLQTRAQTRAKHTTGKNMTLRVNTNTNTKYTCDTDQTRNKLLAQGCT